jgi:hypothetical protein
LILDDYCDEWLNMLMGMDLMDLVLSTNENDLENGAVVNLIYGE